MGCRLTRLQRPRLESETPGALTDSIQTPGVSDHYPECTRQEQGDEETSAGPGDQPQYVPSSSGAATHTDEIEETVITSIRATDVALGLRRIPAGFYAVVRHSCLEWRTEHKRSSVNIDVVEWNGPIPIPSDPSATVCLEVYASFELQPTLGAGERLRELTITVEDLLDCSAKDVPFTLLPMDGDVVSPCSSILITAKHWRRKSNDPSGSTTLAPHCSTTESLGELEDATNQGHRALLRYRKYREKRDLECSIEQFESALSICPLDHPCLAAAQSNLAMAKFILCQVEDTNASLEVPLGLYRNALAARPVGHLDRPSTMVQIAIVHFAQFGKQKDEVKRSRAEALLDEATELSSTDSHENRAAAFLLQLHAGRIGDPPVRADGQSSVEQHSALHSTDEDLGILSVQLLHRFERFGDLTDLQRAITALEELVRSTPIGDDQYSAALGNLGVALSYRFDHVGEPSDLEDAISRLRNAVGLNPHGHPDKPSHLTHLGNSFLARFERLGQLSDLEDAISALRDAVELTPHGHPDKPSRLNNLGTSFRTRFEHLGQLSDLEDAISKQRNAVELTSHSHPHKPLLLSNLGNSFRTRFERLGQLSDLEDAISKQRDAVDLTPHGHPDKPSRLYNVGTSFLTHFERLGQLSDLEDAISALRDAVELTPHGHPHKPSRLNNLGNSLLTRFERLGQLSDLEDAISALRDAHELFPHGHLDRPSCLANLGNSFLTRFERFGQLSDLEDAISALRDADELTPRDHPDKPSSLTNLGNSFLTRFERLGQLSDLGDAISKQKDAVELTPDGHLRKPSLLNNLGVSFLTRFERLGQLSDLEDALSAHCDAVVLAPHGYPDKPSLLDNLGNSFLARFERLGQPSDLEDAILAHRGAVELAPHGHPDKPGLLNNLGNSFLTHFERLGQLSDLEDAISALSDAVELTPHGHPDKPSRLNNLGTSFLTHFECLGQLSDLEGAISKQRDAVELTPYGHPDKPSYLSNLGASFRTRFERLGQLSDLEDAISALRDAVELTPHGHPDKPSRLNNVGTSFLTHFERLGQLSDLEDAISALRDAVELAPHGHPHKPALLNNLGTSIFTRFERLRELSDLEDAISAHRDAVELTPHGHLHKPNRLSNLGNSFRTRFERLGQLSDLEDAISALRDAVELTVPGHPHKPVHLTNLGNSFLTRFERLGQLNDLEGAISSQRDGLDLTPHDHPLKPFLLSHLGNSFRARFERLGQLSDLEDAISNQRDGADLTPHDHPHKPLLLLNLGNSFQARFERLGEPSDAPFVFDFVHHRDGYRVLGIYTTTPSLVHVLLPLPSFLNSHGLASLSLIVTLSSPAVPMSYGKAAAAALDSGLPETAVEWLEQGRSIVWGELFQLRNSYEELLSAHPEHGRRLRELSAALEHASTAHEKSLSALQELSTALEYDSIPRENSLSALLEHTQSSAMRSLQVEADTHRTLAIERDKLLHEIRRFPGFERFLLHKEFSRLRASAHSGPVVILNATESRCDALIVLADVDHVIHVPLPNFTFKQSMVLQKLLEKLLGHSRDIHPDERKAKLIASPHNLHTWNPETQGGDSWEFLLSNLWKGVVGPVLDALAFKTPGDPSRIFWCPTGPFVFLPIHGAGFYDTQDAQPGHKVSDFVVSSYVPNLSILTLSPNFSTPSGDLRLLTVRQPSSDGLRYLSGVATELTHIREVIRDSPSAHITLLESSDGTVEEVLSLMKEADWVHFACHGIQDAVDSGLCLADRRRLKLSDIIAVSRPHGGLAFLSACQTAMGYEHLSDEALHITAGMLFAGYGGVVGTMWSIGDEIAPCVARDVYGQLFRTGTRPDYREAAGALHVAIEHLRHSNASFLEWLPFIHVGL
ncbi:CHAT domain-containing protein [Boletus coccyginus]|nr:CHAT domain-containing protein [Boletus coccyginus]